MANHTISITNRINFLGAGPATLWGNTGAYTMTWGTDKWGSESEDVPEAVMHLIEDTATFTPAYLNAVITHLNDGDTLNLASAISDLAIGTVASTGSTLTMSSDVTVEYLTNGIWYYVFPDNVTNHEASITTTYTSPSPEAISYATPSAPATVWS